MCSENGENMPKASKFTVAIGANPQSSGFIETVHCLPERESERTANVLWQKHEQEHDSVYVIAWNSGKYELDYDTMNKSVVYFRCRPGIWFIQGIGDDDD